MQLNRFTDYGLRVLMYLHGCDADELVTIESIARRFEIPQNHLNKVVQRMARLGWVQSRPGRHGGIRLADRDTSLRLGDVLRELEGHPPGADLAREQTLREPGLVASASRIERSTGASSDPFLA